VVKAHDFSFEDPEFESHGCAKAEPAEAVGGGWSGAEPHLGLGLEGLGSSIGYEGQNEVTVTTESSLLTCVPILVHGK